MKNIKRKLDYKNHIYIKTAKQYFPLHDLTYVYVELSRKNKQTIFCYQIPGAHSMFKANTEYIRFIHNLPKNKIFNLP